jgi:hypothetical protein
LLYVPSVNVLSFISKGFSIFDMISNNSHDQNAFSSISFILLGISMEVRLEHL